MHVCMYVYMYVCNLYLKLNHCISSQIIIIIAQNVTLLPTENDTLCPGKSCNTSVVH